ncbi:Beta-conglycinin, alpha chain [Glycine soja]|nr:Beta-conglycinin, alpha chain [Glycine soja]
MSQSQKRNNLYHFSSNSFDTLFKNQYGHIRLFQRFNQRSPQLENLRDYHVVEFKFNPNALFLPQHADSEFLLERLHPGDALRIPAGTTYYLVNPDYKETFPIVKIINLCLFRVEFLPIQQSYLQGFSENILEASFNTEFEEINRVLLGEEGQQQGVQRLQERVMVELSKEQIQELSRHAKSSSRKTITSKNEPFNLRSRKPIYSNKFGSSSSTTLQFKGHSDTSD